MRSDVYYIAPRLRLTDRSEVLATGHGDVLDVLLRGFEESEVCLTLLTHTGVPFALLGVVSINKRWGRVWMLATDELNNMSIPFLKHTTAVLNALNFIYPVLYNIIDTRNDTHMTWLKWCGFNMMQKFEINNVTFQYFMKGCGTSV